MAEDVAELDGPQHTVSEWQHNSAAGVVHAPLFGLVGGAQD